MLTSGTLWGLLLPFCLYKEGKGPCLCSRRGLTARTHRDPSALRGRSASEEAPIGRGGVRLPNDSARSTLLITARTQPAGHRQGSCHGGSPWMTHQWQSCCSMSFIEKKWTVGFKMFVWFYDEENCQDEWTEFWNWIWEPNSDTEKRLCLRPNTPTYVSPVIHIIISTAENDTN